ncbi:UNVERIFIED_CONTAM: hypothetical protein RMT77_013487 [Armadillidium vulgare]
MKGNLKIISRDQNIRFKRSGNLSISRRDKSEISRKISHDFVGSEKTKISDDISCVETSLFSILDLDDSSSISNNPVIRKRAVLEEHSKSVGEGRRFQRAAKKEVPEKHSDRKHSDKKHSDKKHSDKKHSDEKHLKCHKQLYKFIHSDTKNDSNRNKTQFPEFLLNLASKVTNRTEEVNKLIYEDHFGKLNNILKKRNFANLKKLIHNASISSNKLHNTSLLFQAIPKKLENMSYVLHDIFKYIRFLAKSMINDTHFQKTFDKLKQSALALDRSYETIRQLSLKISLLSENLFYQSKMLKTLMKTFVENKLDSNFMLVRLHKIFSVFVRIQNEIIDLLNDQKKIFHYLNMQVEILQKFTNELEATVQVDEEEIFDRFSAIVDLIQGMRRTPLPSLEMKKIKQYHFHDFKNIHRGEEEKPVPEAHKNKTTDSLLSNPRFKVCSKFLDRDNPCRNISKYVDCIYGKRDDKNKTKGLSDAFKKESSATQTIVSTTTVTSPIITLLKTPTKSVTPFYNASSPYLPSAMKSTGSAPLSGIKNQMLSQNISSSTIGPESSSKFTNTRPSSAVIELSSKPTDILTSPVVTELRSKPTDILKSSIVTELRSKPTNILTSSVVTELSSKPTDILTSTELTELSSKITDIATESTKLSDYDLMPEFKEYSKNLFDEFIRNGASTTPKGGVDKSTTTTEPLLIPIMDEKKNMDLDSREGLFFEQDEGPKLISLDPFYKNEKSTEMLLFPEKLLEETYSTPEPSSEVATTSYVSDITSKSEFSSKISTTRYASGITSTPKISRKVAAEKYAGSITSTPKVSRKVAAEKYASSITSTPKVSRKVAAEKYASSITSTPKVSRKVAAEKYASSITSTPKVSRKVAAEKYASSITSTPKVSRKVAAEKYASSITSTPKISRKVAAEKYASSITSTPKISRKVSGTRYGSGITSTPKISRKDATTKYGSDITSTPQQSSKVPTMRYASDITSAHKLSSKVGTTKFASDITSSSELSREVDTSTYAGDISPIKVHIIKPSGKKEISTTEASTDEKKKIEPDKKKTEIGPDISMFPSLKKGMESISKEISQTSESSVSSPSTEASMISGSLRKGTESIILEEISQTSESSVSGKSTEASMISSIHRKEPESIVLEEISQTSESSVSSPSTEASMISGSLRKGTESKILEEISQTSESSVSGPSTEASMISSIHRKEPESIVLEEISQTSESSVSSPSPEASVISGSLRKGTESIISMDISQTSESSVSGPSTEASMISSIHSKEPESIILEEISETSESSVSSPSPEVSMISGSHRKEPESIILEEISQTSESSVSGPSPEASMISGSLRKGTESIIFMDISQTSESSVSGPSPEASMISGSHRKGTESIILEISETSESSVSSPSPEASMISSIHRKEPEETVSKEISQTSKSSTEASMISSIRRKETEFSISTELPQLSKATVSSPSTEEVLTIKVVQISPDKQQFNMDLNAKMQSSMTYTRSHSSKVPGLHVWDYDHYSDGDSNIIKNLTPMLPSEAATTANSKKTTPRYLDIESRRFIAPKTTGITTTAKGMKTTPRYTDIESRRFIAPKTTGITTTGKGMKTTPRYSDIKSREFIAPKTTEITTTTKGLKTTPRYSDIESRRFIAPRTTEKITTESEERYFDIEGKKISECKLLDILTKFYGSICRKKSKKKTHPTTVASKKVTVNRIGTLVHINLPKPTAIPAGRSGILRKPTTLPVPMGRNLLKPTTLPVPMGRNLLKPTTFPAATTGNLRKPITLPAASAEKVTEKSEEVFKPLFTGKPEIRPHANLMEDDYLQEDDDFWPYHKLNRLNKEEVSPEKKSTPVKETGFEENIQPQARNLGNVSSGSIPEYHLDKVNGDVYDDKPELQQEKYPPGNRKYIGKNFELPFAHNQGKRVDLKEPKDFLEESLREKNTEIAEIFEKFKKRYKQSEIKPVIYRHFKARADIKCDKSEALLINCRITVHHLKQKGSTDWNLRLICGCQMPKYEGECPEKITDGINNIIKFCSLIMNNMSSDL